MRQALRLALPGIGMLLALCLLAVLRFQALGEAYWRADDPAILNHSLLSPGLSAYHDAGHWRALSPSNLTPWLTVSFKFDLALAGLSPAFFYAHQVAALLALLAVAWILLRRFLSRPWAFACLALFLLGAPTGAVVEALMTRHYLEGLLASLLCLEAWLRAQDAPAPRARRGWLVAALGAYAVAASAKEIYVPLPLVMLAWPGRGGLGERLRASAPFLVLLLGYALWRRHMLGAFGGGYAEPSSLLGMALWSAYGRALTRLPADLLGSGAVLLLPVLAGLVLWGTGRRRADRVWLPVLLVCALGPLLPLASFPGLHGPDRYLFLPWFLLCVLVALALQAFQKQRLPWLKGTGLATVTAAALWAGLALAASVQEREQQRQRALHHRELELQGRFLWEASSSQSYVPSPGLAAGFWYATELCAIRARQRDPCPPAVQRGLDLQAPLHPVRALRDGVMRPLGPGELAAELAVDRERPLSIEMELSQGFARWRVGPSERGRYYLVSARLGRYPLPAQGTLRTDATELDFVLLHEEESGAFTASGPLRVAVGAPLRWRRPSSP